MYHVLGVAAVLMAVGASPIGTSTGLTPQQQAAAKKYLQLLPLKSTGDNQAPSVVYIIRTPNSERDNNQPPVGDLSNILTNRHNKDELLISDDAVYEEPTQTTPTSNIEEEDVNRALADTDTEHTHTDDDDDDDHTHIDDEYDDTHTHLTDKTTQRVPLLSTEYNQNKLLNPNNMLYAKKVDKPVEEIPLMKMSPTKRSGNRNNNMVENSIIHEYQRVDPVEIVHRDRVIHEVPRRNNHKNYRVSLVFN